MELGGVVARAAREAGRRTSGRPSHVGPDGLRVCDACGEPLECRKSYRGRTLTLPCACACDRVFVDEFADDLRRRARDAARARCFTSRAAWGHTFEADDGGSGEAMETCRRWAERQVGEGNGFGLVLHGAPDAGKTYAADCIANHLLDNGVAVVSRSTPWVLGRPYDETQAVIQTLSSAPVAVIDDLGAERATAYGQEVVYSIVDNRYRDGLPTIVTTNLGPDEMGGDVKAGRVWNRLLERCLPVEFATGRRRYRQSTHAQMMAELFG